ncbi:MAG: hypothetical protein R3212_10045 [Xanthomonadales bacterium]|nr:hypothetical protein [Xanthomonadales bacterium]
MVERTKHNLTDESYQQMRRMPVETTLTVFRAIFGPQWKKGALAIFGRYYINEIDIGQWERFGCPPWVLNDMLPFLTALVASSEGARREELEAALRTVPPPPRDVSATRH